MGRNHWLPDYALHALLAPHRLQRASQVVQTSCPWADDAARRFEHRTILIYDMRAAAQDSVAGRATTPT